MDAIDRILAAARSLRPERFNDLVRSAEQARSLGRLRYWQEVRFVALAGAAGVAAAGLTDFLAVFVNAEPIPVVVSVTTPEEYVAAWRSNAEWRDQFMAGAARDLSKTGWVTGVLRAGPAEYTPRRPTPVSDSRPEARTTSPFPTRPGASSGRRFPPA